MARNRKNKPAREPLAVVGAAAREQWIRDHGGIGGWRTGGSRPWTQRNGRAHASRTACRGPAARTGTE